MTRPYNHRERVQTPVGSRTRTKASLASETDINFIVKRFQRTGAISHVTQMQAAYGDFTEAADLKNMMDRVDLACEDFEGLPATVRAACDNDPVTLVHMLGSPEGLQALADAENPYLPKPEVPATPEGAKAPDPPTSESNSES